MLATDAATDMFCDDLARLLCLPLPKGAILRFRYAVYPDPGEAIARHLDVRHNVGIERIHLPSAQLHDGRIDFYRQVTAAGGFRRERALLEVRIPSSLKSDAPASFSEKLLPGAGARSRQARPCRHRRRNPSGLAQIKDR